MRTAHTVGCGVVLAASLVASPRAAGAQTATPIPVRLEVTLAPTCPAGIDIEAKLSVRAPDLVSTADAPRVFRFAITGEPGAFIGQLTVEDAAGSSQREITSGTCEEAAAALVVVAALAIDAVRPAPPPPPPPPVATPSPPPLTPAPPARVSEVRTLEIGTGIELSAGLTPAECWIASGWAAWGKRHWVLRIGAAISTQESAVKPEGVAQFRWFGGRADVQPIVLRTGRWHAAPVLGIEAGVLRASGEMVDAAATSNRPWLSPYAALRMGTRRGRFGVDLEGRLAAPIIRDHFMIQPVTAHRPEPVVTAISLQLVLAL